MTGDKPTRAGRLLDKARQLFEPDPASVPVWRESPEVCALADAERHLGHAVRVGNYWIGYDAIHVNPTSDGFRIIGTFASVEAAKAAIENSIAQNWTWDATGVEPRPVKKKGLMTLSASALH